MEHPFPFAEAFDRAVHAELGSVTALVVSKPDLMAMKAQVGRPKDLEDIRLPALTPGDSLVGPRSEDNEEGA